MPKIIAAFFILTQILFANLNFDVFYDENASSDKINAKLDEILNFFEKNPQRINDKFGDFNESATIHFFFNQRVAKEHKFDTRRIERLLKFKPDLNQNLYDINGTTPLECILATGATNELIKSEATKLAKILLRREIDLKTPKLLYLAYQTGDFELFNILLEKGARNADGLLLSFAFDMLNFLRENGFTIYTKEPASPLMRKFVKSQKFITFYNEKERFFTRALKFIKFDEISERDIDAFLKFNSYIDNAQGIQFLLENGLKENERVYEILQNFAREFKSEAILKELAAKP